ncbi:putative ribosomal protein S6 kinase alpha-1 isoform X1 [Sesbania bispinosa]|nr:putative ribosomal protein S6 kinase alpha-1 isoform X1 [Sesbania bispinosa]
MEDLLLVRAAAGAEWRSFLEEDLLHSAAANGQNGEEQNGGPSSRSRSSRSRMEELLRQSAQQQNGRV